MEYLQSVGYLVLYLGDATENEIIHGFADPRAAFIFSTGHGEPPGDITDGKRRSRGARRDYNSPGIAKEARAVHGRGPYPAGELGMLDRTKVTAVKPHCDGGGGWSPSHG